MGRNILLVVACMLVSDWANVFLKLGAARTTFTLSWSGIVAGATEPFLVAGFLLYAAGMLLWLRVLAQYPFGAAMMIFSLHYLHLMVLARFVFKEAITWRMWAGAVFVMLGVALFTSGAPAKQP